jgi:hypothetical protein
LAYFKRLQPSDVVRVRSGMVGTVVLEEMWIGLEALAQVVEVWL